jgi:hypothetical protein
MQTHRKQQSVPLGDEDLVLPKIILKKLLLHLKQT